MSLNIFEYVNNLAIAIRNRGENIFEQGDESDGRMYFVAEGELAVVREIDGETHELNHLYTGDFFGEMAILNKQPRSATIKVVSLQARLGFLDEEMFMKIALINPVFHYSLLKLVIQRLGKIEDDIEIELADLKELKG